MAATQHVLRGGSKARYDINCPDAAMLRSKVPDVDAGPAALRGNAIHDAIEHILKTGEEADSFRGVPMAPERGFINACLEYFDSVEMDRYEVEKFMLDDEIPECGGTADVVYTRGRTLGIIDWKSGRIPVRAENNDALMFYAWLACVGKDVDNVELHIVQPPNNSMTTVSMAELQAWRARYVAAYEATGTKAGPHCQYCPAMSTCPLKRNRAVEASQWRGANLAEALDLAEEVEQWIKAVRKDAEAAMMAGTHLEGWKVVASRPTRKWTLDDADVIDYLVGTGLELDEAAPRKVLSPPQAGKLVRLDETMIEAKSASQTIAREADKRDALNPGGLRDLSSLTM